MAKVQVNGRDAGTLIWSPYRLDITTFLKHGENRLRIWVTKNTEANARAVGGSHNVLWKIDLCGLEGPVSLIPYVKRHSPSHQNNSHRSRFSADSSVERTLPRLLGCTFQNQKGTRA